MLEHLSHTLVGLGGALEVLRGANLLADILGLGSLLVWRVVSLDLGVLVPVPE